MRTKCPDHMYEDALMKPLLYMQTQSTNFEKKREKEIWYQCGNKPIQAF